MLQVAAKPPTSSSATPHFALNSSVHEAAQLLREALKSVENSLESWRERGVREKHTLQNEAERAESRSAELEQELAETRQQHETVTRQVDDISKRLDGLIAHLAKVLEE